MFWFFSDNFLPLDSVVSIQIQLVVWHVSNLDCWPLFTFLPRVPTLSPLCNSYFRIWFPEILYSDSHFDMFSRQLCFLLFLVFLYLFIPCSWFLSLFRWFHAFFFSFIFISFPCFLFWSLLFFLISFHSFSFCVFLLKKQLPIQTTCNLIHCLVLLIRSTCSVAVVVLVIAAVVVAVVVVVAVAAAVAAVVYW